MKSENETSRLVRLRAAGYGVKLLRNNSGAYSAKNPPSAGTRWGLGNESKALNRELKTGDFVGWSPVIITAEMVGKTIPVFTNFEAKKEGFKERKTYNKNTREYGQNNFNLLVINAGGLAGFVTSAEDVDRLIKEFIERLKS